jgi:hypothetical protein
MADYGSYAIPLGSVQDWDPNNTYDGNPTADDPLAGYAGYGPSGGAAATATPTDAFISQNNNLAGKDNPNLGTDWLAYANGTGSYAPGAQVPQAQPVDPYNAGIDQIYGQVTQQGANYDARLQPYTDAAANNYWSGAAARQGILDQQAGALNGFANADGAIYGQYAGQLAGYDASGNQAVSDMGAAFNQSAAMDAGNVGSLGGSLNQANYLDTQNMGQLSGSLNQANALDAQNMGQLSSALGASTALGAQSYGQLQSLSGQMQQLTAGGYGADVVSDPNDIARQNDAYGQLSGFANGAGDYTSQAAGAYADADAVAAQKDVLGQLKEQSKPQLTDAERYLYMQSRLQEEQSNRGNRDANMRELERSGMSGSTMALSNLNASSQQTATTRSLADLGANAKAIDRASAALVNEGNLASTLSGQSFQQAYGRGQAADAASQFNTSTRLQGSVAAGNEANQMRNANDALNEFNKSQSLQQQRFQDQYAADQQQQAWGRGVDVSNAGFNQANLQSRNASIQSDAGFKQSGDISANAGLLSNAGFQQSRDMSSNAKTLSDAQFTQSGDLSRNATNLGNASLTNIGQQRQSAGDIARTGAQMNSDWLTGTQNFGNMGMTAQRDNTTALGVAADQNFRQVGTDQVTDQMKNALLQKKVDNAAEDRRTADAEKAAKEEAQRARDAAKEEADSSGLLGTPILSRDGIFGIKGIPVL